jgi:hypothetical protein
VKFAIDRGRCVEEKEGLASSLKSHPPQLFIKHDQNSRGGGGGLSTGIFWGVRNSEKGGKLWICFRRKRNIRGGKVGEGGGGGEGDGR